MQITSEIVKDVVVINENTTALDAAILMTEKYIGSVVVKGDSGVRGLFTERDLMMNVVGERKDPATVLVKDIMPPTFIKVGPDETCTRCLELMKENRCRHLLIFEGDHFVGIVSLRDVVAAMMSEKEMLIDALSRYITG